MSTQRLVIALVAVAICAASGCRTNSVALLDDGPSQALWPRTWVKRADHAEPAVAYAAMCYDERREVCVLHGGVDRWGNDRSETWLWDGNRWSLNKSVNSLPSSGHGMVWTDYWPAMWGGDVGSPYLLHLDADRHTLHRIGLYPGLGPTRSWVAYDQKRRALVLTATFGVSSEHLGPVMQEMALDKKERTEIDIGSLPHTQKAYLPIVYDPERQKIVCIGARQSGVDRRNDAIQTWTWDGAEWKHTWTACDPHQLESCRILIYDPDRKCVVAICRGGYSSLELLELRGDAWVQRETTPLWYPEGLCAAYDRKRNEVVIHGGRAGNGANVADATWTLGTDGQWRLKHGGDWPVPSIWYSAMIYDEQLRRVIMLDHRATKWSRIAPSQQPKLEGTTLYGWSWNGRAWERFDLLDIPAEQPSPKALAWDPGRHVMMLWISPAKDRPGELWERHNGVWGRNELFGGYLKDTLACYFDQNLGALCWLSDARESTEGQVVFNTLSIWNGRSLETRSIQGLTPALSAPASYTYDRDRKQLVLFGKHAVSGIPETWEFDGDEWTRCNPEHTPPAHGSEAFAYLGSIGRCVLFGGGKKPRRGSYEFYDDHWEWDGKDWHNVPTAAHPGARMMPLVAEDRDAGCLVLFGGSDGFSDAHDTWEYGLERR